MPTKFSKAIVRTPGKSLPHGLCNADLGLVDYHKAVRQHADYVAALQDCGLEVICLPAIEDYPDGTFVEDVALLFKDCAILTNPRMPSRKGEVAAIREVVRDLFADIHSIAGPATLEAGDIMRVGDHFYVGITGRTNESGGRELLAILQDYALGGSLVKVDDLLHLKTGVSYLENENLLISNTFPPAVVFDHLQQLVVDDVEAYAANSLWVNDRVLVPAGYPRTKEMISAAGYQTITLDMSEFRKLDGGLSCLSLRF